MVPPTAVLTHRLAADDQISANLELVFTTLPVGNSVVVASYQRLVNTWAWSSRTGKGKVRGILMEFFANSATSLAKQDPQKG